MSKYPDPLMVPGVPRTDDEGNNKTYEHEIVTDYWFHHYCDMHCSLCGNCGVIDSRGVKTAFGLTVGKLNYCICPNGQVLRYQKADLKRWLLQSK